MQGCFIVVLLLSCCQGAPVNTDLKENAEDHELIGGFFQGDMEIEISRNGVISESQKWPNGIVNYKIDAVFDIAHTSYILNAMKNIEAVSCLRFIPVADTQTSYLYITGEPSGCHAKVGYRPHIQTLNLQIDHLDEGCFKLGTIMHEILHSLGFHHQHSATNRDDYVWIVEQNIKVDKQKNFIKYDDHTISDLGIAYDYSSIMHYSSMAFSKNGKRTIIPFLGENIKIGQRRALSLSDIAKLNLMYKCPVLL